MSDLLITVLFLIAGVFVIAVVAAFRQVHFKAGLKTGDHEISVELNGLPPDKLTARRPLPGKK
jgi:hypothetical protein